VPSEAGGHASADPRHGDDVRVLRPASSALDALEPKDNQVLVEGMVESVLHDGTVASSEAESLRAACGLMHVPPPALLARVEFAASGAPERNSKASRGQSNC
jgi:hypothetical protein